MITKLRLVFTITIAFLSFYGSAQSNYWKQEASSNGLDKGFTARFDVKKGQQFSFDEQLFKKELRGVSVAKKNSKIVYFPDIKGDMIAFQVFEAPVLSAELSQKYPNIKSYAGHAVGNQKAKIRFSVSHKGIQTMLVNADQSGTTFMQKDSGNTYVLYTRDPNASRNKNFICSTKAVVEKSLGSLTQRVVTDQVLRKFRLAVTASGEYTQYHGGTVADALAAINATITRINQVFETDLAITFELIPGLEEIIFLNPETDPYSGNLSTRTQVELSNRIGAANYDIGILFNESNQSDGNAGFIGAVCIDNRKGSAFATGENPEGDIFDLDFVAHEIGHQFGANHTWSFESEGTQVQVEPASGTTIMGYAGITGINNVEPDGDDYFHYVSIVQMTDYLKTINCAQSTSLTNVPPVITPAGSFTIPKSTAFVLTGDATDADVTDVLTFVWEQIDDGIVTQSSFGPTNLTGANFRSLRPSIDPQRYFPKLSRVLEGNLTQTSPAISSAWETVSDIEREMNFALTVRDNAIGGGQVVSDLVNVFVDNSAGPFVVTSQSTDVVAIAGGVETITWDVGNTNMAPINTQTVAILLSIDGGQTFPISLAENAPNNGSHDVVLPGNPTTAARIMVKANENIFFAVNASNFTIDASEIVLSFEELEQEVCQGDVLVVPFTYETFDGFNEEATFSVITDIVNFPSEVAITLFPETAIATDTPIEITFTSTENVPVGTYPIRVLATTDGSTKEIIFNLNVFNTDFTEITLVSPANGLIDTPTSILLEWEEDVVAVSYAIEIATDTTFANIQETASVIVNSYVPTDLENQTQYFWRIKPKNSCGEGTFGSAFSFTTIQFSCQTKVDSSLPLVISTIGTPTVISEITIFDDLPISDIDVHLEIDHTFLSDLVVTLTSPAGTSVVLISNSCDDSQNVAATFDDDANSFICSGTPAINGTVKPLGSLSSFNGESTLGVWTLTVADKAPSDGGSVKSFSMDVCAEGQFRPDADGDGVFDDGPDLCLGTPKGTAVDVTGCPVLIIASNNFQIEVQSESCRSSNDGAIRITAVLPLDYTVSVTGNGVDTADSFDTTYMLDNLMSGTYALCITATDGILTSSEQCFDIVISEPELLGVASKIALDGSVVDLELQGASLYNIELNGIVTQTEASEFRVNLKEGLNSLKVTTNVPCQGTHEEQFFFSIEPVIYPNPFTDLVTITFGANVASLQVQLFSSNGRFIKNKTYKVDGFELQLDLSTLSAGTYFIKFEGDTVKGTSIIIKE